jgi:dihydrofolate synthase/folylpolyglutamate synthase
MLATKDATGFLAPLAAQADALIAVPVHNTAARPPEELAAIARAVGLAASTAPTLEDALGAAVAQAPSSPRILICGSLYLAGEVLAASGGVD